MLKRWMVLGVIMALSLLISACGDSNSDDGGDPVGTLNDTGITAFADAGSNSLTEAPEDYPGQDASFGRDALAAEGLLEKTGGGVGGFDFTKIGVDGQALADQEADYATSPWRAVQDNVTGLMWEVKTDDDGLHDRDWIYSWYNSDAAANGGEAGTENSGTCVDTDNCDTEHYVAAVNAAGLAGYSDWRLPSREELRSLVDYGMASPAIDETYFPHTQSNFFWSSSPYAPESGYAWVISFSDGNDPAANKDSSFAVRLVRGGE